MKALYYNRTLNKIVIPEKWNELSKQQLLKIVALFNSAITEPELACDKALYILSGRSLYSFLRIPVDIRMTMHEHVMWVFEEQSLTEQLIPKYDGLYGPDSEFNNLQLAEFHHAEMACYRYIHEKDEDALNELIAILYREPKKKKKYNRKRNAEGDLRIPFSFAEIEWHKRKVKHWPVNVKQAIMIGYDACRQMIVRDYHAAFNSDEINTKDYFDGMFGIIRNLSGDKYGSFKDVEQLLVHNAFMEVVLCIDEAEELKRQLKSHGTN
jgi:hypothetical protein